jgi:2-oxoisovalerate dehydrogenase E1 component beta subunit
MLHYCLEAANTLDNEGTSVEVVDLRSLKPLDTETIVASVKRTGKVLVVHEDNITGGVGAEVAAVVAQEAFDYLDGPVTRLCGPDIPTMPYAPTLEDAYMPNADSIAQALRELAAY